MLRCYPIPPSTPNFWYCSCYKTINNTGFEVYGGHYSPSTVKNFRTGEIGEAKSYIHNIPYYYGDKCRICYQSHINCINQDIEIRMFNKIFDELKKSQYKTRYPVYVIYRDIPHNYSENYSAHRNLLHTFNKYKCMVFNRFNEKNCCITNESYFPPKSEINDAIRNYQLICVINNFNNSDELNKWYELASTTKSPVFVFKVNTLLEKSVSDVNNFYTLSDRQNMLNDMSPIDNEIELNYIDHKCTLECDCTNKNKNVNEHYQSSYEPHGCVCS